MLNGKMMQGDGPDPSQLDDYEHVELAMEPAPNGAEGEPAVEIAKAALTISLVALVYSTIALVLRQKD